DPATLSRDPAVGADYAADPLVWHGDFVRPTLEGLQQAMRTITEAGGVGDHPLLYLHAEDDRLVPLPASWEGLRRCAARRRARRPIRARSTRSSMRRTARRSSPTSSTSSTRCWPTVDDADQMNSSGSNSSISMIRT